MKNLLFLAVFPIIFCGCFNERGVSLKYYNDCKEYYDAAGEYHKVCDPNVIDWN